MNCTSLNIITNTKLFNTPVSSPIIKLISVLYQSFVLSYFDYSSSVWVHLIIQRLVCCQPTNVALLAIRMSTVAFHWLLWCVRTWLVGDRTNYFFCFCFWQFLYSNCRLEIKTIHTAWDGKRGEMLHKQLSLKLENIRGKSNYNNLIWEYHDCLNCVS